MEWKRGRLQSSAHSPSKEQQIRVFLGNQREELMEGYLGIQVNRRLGRVELYKS